MKKIFLLFSTACVFSVLAYETSAQVIVRKGAEYRNPTLFFKGVAGSQEYSAQLASCLKNCGWFDVVGGGAAEYVVDGSGSAASANVAVRNPDGSAAASVGEQISNGGPAKAARRTVDAILKKLFGVQGICSTKIAFTAEVKTGVKEIYVCDFDGSNPVRCTTNSTLSVEPDWMPGRESVVYTLYGKMSTALVEYDIPSKRSRRLVQFPGLNSCGAISPNGALIAMIASMDKEVNLYVKAVNSAAMQKLTSGKSVEASPCWSPDGSQICYVSDAPGRPSLYVISPKGGAPRKLQTLGSESLTPAWSCTNKIAYSAKMGGSYSIAILDLSGKEAPRIVVSAAGDWENPSWAPDGRHIVCSRTVGGKASLYIVDTATGKNRQIFGGTLNTSFPAWSGMLK